MAVWCLLLLFLLFEYSECVVNIATNMEPWYCNTNPLNLHPIEPLSNDDLSRINKLEQVHVMTRHGTRTHQENIQKYFPNIEQYYHCNISTITSRIEYNDNNNNNNNKYFVSMLKKYEYDNQYLLHSNCQRMQSYPTLIKQHQENAQILINAYMKNNSSSQLFNIYETNKISISESEQFMKFYTSNRERCMLSTMVLVSNLLNITSSNKSFISPIIETITNDDDFNPYTPPNIVCAANKQFIDWKNKYIVDITDNYIKLKHNQYLGDKYNKSISQYIEQGGKIINSSIFGFDSPGFTVTFFYCNGFDIPLKNDTFWNLVNDGYQYFIAIHPNKTSVDEIEQEYVDKKQCYNHFLSIPMYKRYLDDINLLINKDNNYKKFILHSCHDSSIAFFLNGLGLHDGIIPYFAQMFTLEIYSANKDNQYNINNNIQYLFRWTNKGKFIPYKPCLDEYNINELNGNGKQLCDLNILLMNGFKNVNITQREWAQNSCKTILDECICGYCNDQKLNDNDQDINKWIFEKISFIIGIIVGLLIFSLTMLIIKYLKYGKIKNFKLTQNQQNYQQTRNDSDIELNELNEPITTQQL